MDLKVFLSDLIAGGFVQKRYVFIWKPRAFSEFPVLSHYFIKSVPLDCDFFLIDFFLIAIPWLFLKSVKAESSVLKRYSSAAPEVRNEIIV